MYALFLNPITANTEVSECVATSEDIETLKEFLDSNSVPGYSDQGHDFFNGGEKTYFKNYMKGSPLEMFNTPEMSFCNPCGIIEIPSLNDIQQRYNILMAEDTTMWDNYYGRALRL